MFRRWFWLLSVALLAGIALLSRSQPGTAWSLVLVLPVMALGAYDCVQREHAILRNFPVIGHGRYLLEMVRPEIQQYFVETNIDGQPIARELRSIVYRRAKGELDTVPFGTQHDVYRVGYEWASHSLAPLEAAKAAPRVRLGGVDCSQPYSSSLLNVSAMSYGSLSGAAIRALNLGARAGGFAHNTGEGGIAPHHRHGGDLIWQIGTGYFGCRSKTGLFDPDRFAEAAQDDAIKAIELKLSQGAKPGHGGILPGKKVTLEIARIRGVPIGETVFSPPGHSAFGTPRELLELIARLRELSRGKPVGFKLCVGRRTDFFAVCKAMLETEITPDFITVDGGEGGTGAAPLEFANSLGMPGRDALIFVHSALRGAGLRDRLKIVYSGKVLTAFHLVRAFALGADVCNSARGMMLALGCIQALRCNNNTCPTGVATQNAALEAGLDVSDKSERVRRFQAATVHSLLELLGAMGLREPSELRPHHIFRRVDEQRIRHFGELYDFLDPGELLEPGAQLPEGFAADWAASSADRWTDHHPEAGAHGGESQRRSHPIVSAE